MITNTFEIKVALLGNVSAGKTTLLNALFRDKYGEVAMKRTTAGISYFRVHSQSNFSEKDESDRNSQSSANQSKDSVEFYMQPDNPRSADSILKEITEDNRVKISESDEMKEKFFDVELAEPLVQCRKDTKLVLIDIPGINEAGTDNKYKVYVTEKWETFDCVVVVMDGRHGVNTEDQVYLLNLV